MYSIKTFKWNLCQIEMCYALPSETALWKFRNSWYDLFKLLIFAGHTGIWTGKQNDKKKIFFFQYIHNLLVKTLSNKARLIFFHLLKKNDFETGHWRHSEPIFSFANQREVFRRVPASTWNTLSYNLKAQTNDFFGKARIRIGLLFYEKQTLKNFNHVHYMLVN